MTVKGCLAVEATNPVIARCKSGPFSVMIDESTDRNTDKRPAVLVRYFDNASGHIRLLDMPVCNGDTAQEIFDSLDGVLSLGCICHLADLCVKAGMKQWSLPVDDLLIDIWFHFDRSHEDGEKPGRVKRVVDRLAAPTTKLTLLFLGFILPADDTKVGALLPEMDRMLRKLMVKFVPLRLIGGQQDPRTVEFTLLDNEHPDDAIGMPGGRTWLLRSWTPHRLQSVFEKQHLLTLLLSTKYKLYCDSPWEALQEISIPYHLALEVRAFYTAVIRKMLAKFPFDCEVLKDLVVMDLAK
ncbi:hypothetical protein NP493_505g03034 [Ridgeia piscesae]|uniref:Uncharacterized protein n=1 Tax=Ridgeia piscesae TaxID=27915 RepID=A0AAD9NSK5_RIDPI|nr:hypothetical protein NP493_505g03034 [Ridgeia piscesae]